jgi:hypothetical protein
MAQEKSIRDRTEKAALAFNLMPGELAVLGKQWTEDFINAQTELFERLQDWNKQWFDRMQSEATLASEFASKLMSARSVPDAMSAYQQCSDRQLEMLTEDGTHVQKTMEAGARLFSSGGWSASKIVGVST